MLFNSLAFLFVFLPLALAGRQLWRQHTVAWLTLCSLAFYAWWDIRFLPLLLLSVSLNWAAGNAIARRQAWVFYPALCFNLALLVWFKYAAFLFGIPAGLPLPVGISFFTFTQIAFLVDCRRGLAGATSFLPYTLFVSYFPHLVAGPVLHHAQMVPQFRDGLSLRAQPMALGLTVFAIGLAKKVLLADNLAPLANPVFAAGAEPPLLEAWIGVLAYGFQLYFDFSGYSDMALGLSRMLGITLPENFNSPYKASSISDFWRRWHMTLSRFLRDYLYIPLGGSRHGALRRYRNLMLTMLLGGAWHGAGWNFIVWGGLHGLYLVLQQVFGGGAPRWWHRPLTFLAVTVAWVPFRAPDLASCAAIWRGMAGWGGLSLPTGLAPLAPLAQASGLALSFDGLRWIDAGGIGLPLLALAALTAWCAPNTVELMAQRWRARLPWAGGVAALLLVCIFNLHRPSEFLYFQF